MSFMERYNALLSKVREATADAIEHEVAEEVKDIMEEQTEYQVYSYDASAMAMRTRRVDNGGLGDRRNMLHNVESGPNEVVLTLWNAAPFQDGVSRGVSLTQVVEAGDSAFRQPYPRPFIAGTQQEAVASGRAYRALMNGLKRNGI